MARELERAGEFAEELRAAYGERLRSVVLYGSAARGEFREGRSDLNLLVLLDRVDAAALRRGSSLARRWVGEGNPPPMLFGADEWRQSADAFPIEFVDIQDAHRVLVGTDPFAGVEVDRAHLRLQCEHELKAKQVQLREQFMLRAEQPDQLAELFAASASSFLVLFRTLLRLAGAPVPREDAEVVSATAGLAGFAAGPMLDVLALRRAEAPAGVAADDAVAAGYLDAVARAVEFVDALDA